jgi:branched-chain amino acid transport system permease protein
MSPATQPATAASGLTLPGSPSPAAPGTRHGRTVALGLAAFAALAAGGWLAPKWLTFLLTMAAANGLVSLGIVGLMRGGVVPFGQGMVLAIGGYTAALAFNQLGVTDALGLALGGGVAAALVAAPFAPLLSRYRGIFFAMLTLALSMVLRRLQHGPAHAAGPGPARCHGGLHPVPAGHGPGHGDGVAGAGVL